MINTQHRPWVGWSLIGIGILHNTLGITMGWPHLAAAARDGLIGAWDTDPRRGQVYWFLVTGFGLMLAGGAVAALERHDPRLPWGWITALAALTVAGVITMPASGFWTLLAPLGIAVVRRLRTA